MVKSVNDIIIKSCPNSSAKLFALAEKCVLTSQDYGRTWLQIMKTNQTLTAMLVPAMSERLLLIGILEKGVNRFTNAFNEFEK